MNLPPLPPLQDGDIKALYIAEYGTEEGWLSRDGSYFIAGVQAARTYAEQYGRLCADAAVREERKRVSKAEREEAESSSVEAMWKERQGDDYGSY